MDKIFLFLYTFLLISSYSTEFAINKIENSPYICYNKFVPEILTNKGNISNQCELISFQLTNADKIKTYINFSPMKLIDHLWSTYFNPDLQFVPKLSPNIPIQKLEITPDNLNSSIFYQIRAWHSKDYDTGTENVPDCICFNVDYENHNHPNGSELKNFTVKNFQKIKANIGWDIVKFRKTMQSEMLKDTVGLRSGENDAKMIGIWALILSAAAAIFYYFFMITDEAVSHKRLKCRKIF